MKDKRLSNYLAHKKTRPIQTKEEVAQNPDHKINEDFEGYPHGLAKKEIIRPQTRNQQKTAALHTKDGEKKLQRKETDEQESDGSANAFEDK